MVTKRRNKLFAVLAVLFFLLFIVTFLFLAPQATAIDALHVTIPFLGIFSLFFITLGACIFFAVSFVSKNKLHGLLASVFLITYLVLRYYGLRQPFFLVLVVAIFLVLWLFISNQNKQP